MSGGPKIRISCITVLLLVSIALISLTTVAAQERQAFAETSAVSPTPSPTVSPTPSPTVSPTPSPTARTTTSATVSPSPSPTVSPTPSPTVSPTPSPTSNQNGENQTGGGGADPTLIGAAIIGIIAVGLMIGIYFTTRRM